MTQAQITSLFSQQLLPFFPKMCNSLAKAWKIIATTCKFVADLELINSKLWGPQEKTIRRTDICPLVLTTICL